MPSPPKHPSSGGVAPRRPSAAELDTGPTNQEPPRAARKQATAPTLPMGPRSRPASQDFSDAPTYVISREEILGDYAPQSEAPPSSQAPQAPQVSRAPQVASEWDAETTITTAPPEWEQEKERWEQQQDTSHDQPVDPRVQSLRARIEDDYGDIPVDDATLVRAPLKRPPRR
ncbi:MAG TPA: hypothetical protein PLR99_08185 [Polyangiaceae bacterium]|nr:hypothetical protein [Polyangiaceae bacterium]